MRSKLLSSLVLLSFFACKRHANTSKASAEIVASRNAKVKELAHGYSTLVNDFVIGNKCLEATAGFVATYPHNVGAFESGHSEDRSKSSDSIAWGGSAEGNFGIYTLSGDVELESSLIEEELKTSVYTTFTLDAGTLFLDKYELSPYGKGMLDKSLEERFLECGDEFIHQINLGARVYVGIEYSFASTQMKNAFSIALKGGTTVMGKDISVDLWKEKVPFLPISDVNGDVKIIFDQEGGDYQAFLDYKNRNLPKDCYISSVTTVEGSADLGSGHSQCIQAYKKIVQEYVGGIFPNQIKGLEAARGGVVGSGLMPLKYYTLPYRTIGYPQISKPDIELPKELLDLIEQMKELSDKYLKATARARAYRNIFQNEAAQNIPAVKSLKDQVQTVMKDHSFESLDRFVAEAALAKSHYDRVTQVCGPATIEALKRAIRNKDPKPLKGSPALVECQEQTAELRRRIDGILAVIKKEK